MLPSGSATAISAASRSDRQPEIPASCRNRTPAMPPGPWQAGEFILWEGAPLDDSAKFYIIESGQVDCFRTFEVGWAVGSQIQVRTCSRGWLVQVRA